MAHPTTILSFGYDAALMATRSMVLRHAGHCVKEAHSLQDAVLLVQSGAVDLVLVCHTVPQAEQKVLIAAVRQAQRPTPVLSISNTGYTSRAPEPCQTVSSAPEELVAAINSAVHQPRASG